MFEDRTLERAEIQTGYNENLFLHELSGAVEWVGQRDERLPEVTPYLNLEIHDPKENKDFYLCNYHNLNNQKTDTSGQDTLLS